MGLLIINLALVARTTQLYRKFWQGDLLSLLKNRNGFDFRTFYFCLSIGIIRMKIFLLNIVCLDIQ